ncbi:MAG: hypothetical protein MN733_22950 [Nitrososphaera sp.]|nr:hypothetical protein [Nitrososphaera sp.]
MSSNTQKYLIKAAKNTAEIVQSANALDVITDFAEYLKVHQEEQSKREAIAAKRDVLIKAIESERQLIEMYFDKRFAERKSALKSLFDLLKSAIENKDTKTVDSALAGILVHRGVSN